MGTVWFILKNQFGIYVKSLRLKALSLRNRFSDRFRFSVNLPNNLSNDSLNNTVSHVTAAMNNLMYAPARQLCMRQLKLEAEVNPKPKSRSPDRCTSIPGDALPNLRDKSYNP